MADGAQRGQRRRWSERLHPTCPAEGAPSKPQKDQKRAKSSQNHPQQAPGLETGRKRRGPYPQRGNGFPTVPTSLPRCKLGKSDWESWRTRGQRVSSLRPDWSVSWEQTDRTGISSVLLFKESDVVGTAAVTSPGFFAGGSVLVKCG